MPRSQDSRPQSGDGPSHPDGLRFEKLISRLAVDLKAEHDREVAELRAQVARLEDVLHKTRHAANASCVPALSRPPQAAADLELDMPASTEGDSKDASPEKSGAGDIDETAKVHDDAKDVPATTSSGHEGSCHIVTGLSLSTRRWEDLSSMSHWRKAGKAFMEGGTFEAFIGFLIVINVVFIYLQLESIGYEAGVAIGLEAPGGFADIEAGVLVVSHAFTVIFVIELMAKIFILRCMFFYDHTGIQKFNIFDSIVVALTVIDMWILSPMEAGFNVSVLRLMRFLRVFRALRVVRTFEVFSKLRVLVATVSASFFALFWSMVLLGIVMLLYALVMCQAVNTNLLDPAIDAETKAWSYRYYGTPSRSLWTVFELTFSGGWPGYARRLVEKVTPLYSIPFALYIAGVVFAMFRIITALFLKDTLSIAQSDADTVIQDKMREKNAYAQKLLSFFRAADTSGDGIVTLEEFETVLKDERIVAYLACLELDVSQTRHLFHMLDDGDNQVSIEEFVQGALRLKGQARSQDVVAVMHDCSLIMKKLVALEETTLKLLTHTSKSATM